MRRFVLCLILMAMACMAANCEDVGPVPPPIPDPVDCYWVAPDGTTNGDGSRQRPWPDVPCALERVGGGHCITVRPGVYRGPWSIRKSGTQQRPTIVRAEQKWQAVVVGSETHTIWITGDWCVLDGFRVEGARFDGVKSDGDYVNIRNCWVRHNGSQGITAHDVTLNVIERNLVEFNGSNIQFDHGLYVDGRKLVVRSNVVRHNTGYGIQFYDSLQDSLVAHNVIYGQASMRGMVVYGSGNAVVHNTVYEYDTAIKSRGSGHLVANNILVGSCDLQGATKKANYTGRDPGFVDPRKGVLWLSGNSPARGAADLQYSSTSDFWNRPQASPDQGAFAYEAFFETAAARAGWNEGYPYPREKSGVVMPDLWAPP